MLVQMMGLDGLSEYAIQALDEEGGVFQRYAFEEESLVEQKPCGIFNLTAGRISKQLSDDLVIGIDLECRLNLGKAFLAHRLHHLAHTR